MDKSALEGKVAAELHQMATDLGIEGHQRLKKADLIDSILAHENGEALAARAPERTTAVEPSVGAEAAAPADAGGNGEVTDDARAATRETTPGETRPAERPRRAEASERTDRPDPTQRDRTDRQDRQDRPERQDRHERPEGQRPDGSRRRPSREERRRQREERRQREYEMREEELANAPTATGLLDILPEGYGFLRTSGFLPGQQDIYVSLSQVRRFMLRKGDTVTGKVRQPKDNEKYFALLQIDTVNDLDPETAKSRPVFEKLTPLFPHDRFRLETGPTDVTGRIIDMVAPIGKGQRGMVVSPPKAGKTTVLKNIANGIISSSPETHVIILLVDERPEEVTDWQRTVTPAEVVYSTFDKPPDQHIQVTELVLERAKRLAEMGRDVAIILDSITRLARAYNLAAPASGKILSGGIDSTALYPPRRFFGAARNIEEGGSLTIIASALVETGSRMDEGIFEEFKGTGNMELRLDRQLSEKRLFPAINVEASGTRKEELLMPTEELALVWRLRRVLHALEPAAALELLTDKIRTTKSNEQFLKEIEKVKA
ncbi:MAG TPA: transcription termination factor Rho [Actinomycetota bacterium]|nr:transcription termination factor Rho [Actinomycetota bacterium]